jgi:UDP-N-acetylmuramoylalanine--D-glutamate ligase
VRLTRFQEVHTIVSEWAGKRIVVLGLARQGKALARFFGERDADVVVSDLKPEGALASARAELEDLPLRYVFGEHPLELLRGADMLCLSGGIPAQIPIAQAAREQGIRLSNDAELFLESSPTPVIGITGSAGKTTTTALVGAIARQETRDSGSRVWVGGNIGNPLITDLGHIQPGDIVVMELSSFQLEIMEISTQIAAILNITPNHLDRHHTMGAYTAAKARILRFQRGGDIAVLGREDPIAWSLREIAPGKVLTFGVSPPEEGGGAFIGEGQIWLQLEGERMPVCTLDAVHLRGDHNLLNVAAACAVSAAADFSLESMRQGIESFEGVGHRLEIVRRSGGVTWVNDSIATAPERAMAAIRAFDEPMVLLAGGRDKDLPWDGFADMVSRRIDHLILFGEAAELILGAVTESVEEARPFTIEVCPGLDAAVEAAARTAEAGDVVLLSPGGTSYDEFADFEARGERFMQLVRAL